MLPLRRARLQRCHDPERQPGHGIRVRPLDGLPAGHTLPPSRHPAGACCPLPVPELKATGVSICTKYETNALLAAWQHCPPHAHGLFHVWACVTLLQTCVYACPGQGRMRRSFSTAYGMQDMGVSLPVQGLRWRLEVFKTPNKGWAVRSWDAIPQGSYVTSYVGEPSSHRRSITPECC